MFKYKGDILNPKATTALYFSSKALRVDFYSITGAYDILYSKSYKLLFAKNMSTGRLILRTDFPESKFFPILDKMNFNTPF